jgi:hypothetical protein
VTNEPALPASRNTTEDIAVVGSDRTGDLEKKGPDHRTRGRGPSPFPNRAYFSRRARPAKVRYAW